MTSHGSGVEPPLLLIVASPVPASPPGASDELVLPQAKRKDTKIEAPSEKGNVRIGAAEHAGPWMPLQATRTSVTEPRRE